MAERWKTNKRTVWNISYHIIRCPKYRRNVIVDWVESRLKELLLYKAEQIGIEIDTMETMPDHVHLFVKAKPNQSPAYIVHQLKWYTSRMLRKEFPTLKSRLPTLWTRAYYIESIWHISEDTIKKYIEEQKQV